MESAHFVSSGIAGGAGSAESSGSLTTSGPWAAFVGGSVFLTLLPFEHALSVMATARQRLVTTVMRPLFFIASSPVFVIPPTRQARQYADQHATQGSPASQAMMLRSRKWEEIEAA
jgi:glycerol-3-phosphate acyltransferase PlsY